MKKVLRQSIVLGKNRNWNVNRSISSERRFNMGKIASNEGAAKAAVLKISSVSISKGTNISISKSTVLAMTDGKMLANQILSGLEDLVASIQDKADMFPQLAAVMAERDQNQKFDVGGN